MDLFFDGVESSDPGRRFGGCGRGMDDMDLVELAPGMSPAGGFIYGRRTDDGTRRTVPPAERP